MTDDGRNDNDDDPIDLDELVTTAAVAAMPEDVRRIVVQQIREQISVKAGDAAEILFREARAEWEHLEEFLTYAETRVVPELQGPKSAVTDVTNVAVQLSDLLLLLLGSKGPVVDGYLEPTPNCGCERCETIRAKAAAGIRIRASGEEESTRGMN